VPTRQRYRRNDPLIQFARGAPVSRPAFEAALQSARPSRYAKALRTVSVTLAPSAKPSKPAKPRKRFDFAGFEGFVRPTLL
jgi:hypothetical protein